ncbi:hypothetical protein C8J56DRAFT_832181 [Mycena floridula]|nr:hypothetical protein C8J56DRAFT_832181 [Mycena floridula]
MDYDKDIAQLQELVKTPNAYCSGQFDVDNLGLFYRFGAEAEHNARFIDLGNATVDELKAFSEACQPATFGLGGDDVLDESYRRAMKLDSSQFSSRFDLAASGIMDHVKAELAPDSKADMRAELYKLNIYDTGAFFKAHKDTPRGNNMIASLVIVFSTAHEGGGLILRHKGEPWTFDSAQLLGSSEKPSVAYVAFYSDIEHEVLPVMSGYRITLTYNLYMESSAKKTYNIENSIQAPLQATLQRLLSNNSFLAKGGKLGFGLQYEYPYASGQKLQSLHQILKGNDAKLYRACQELNLGPKLAVIYGCGDTYEGKAEVLMYEFLDLTRHWQIESSEELVEVLKETGGVVVSAEKGEEYEDEDGDEQMIYQVEEHEQVTWVTSPTYINKVSANYICYGNEASMSTVYGNMCLIVDRQID